MRFLISLALMLTLLVSMGCSGSGEKDEFKDQDRPKSAEEE